MLGRLRSHFGAINVSAGRVSVIASAKTALLGGAMISAITLSSCGSVEPGLHRETQHLPVEEGFFSGTDGLQLFYRKVGTGADTAVFLHGGPANMSDGGYSLDGLAPV